MGSPGADRENKTVTGAFNLNWAETQKLALSLTKNGIPFAIDNDANVAALGFQCWYNNQMLSL